MGPFGGPKKTPCWALLEYTHFSGVLVGILKIFNWVNVEHRNEKFFSTKYKTVGGKTHINFPGECEFTYNHGNEGGFQFKEGLNLIPFLRKRNAKWGQ